MKKVYIFDHQPPYDPHFWDLTRDELEEGELRIYDLTLPKLSNPNLVMLAAYSYLANLFRQSFENKELARHVRRAMIFARNGLGFWKPIPIDYMELLLDEHPDWPPILSFLDSAWQVGKD